MTMLKCKMCGGALQLTENRTTYECEYCGTLQTLPKLDDERRSQQFDRANFYRMKCEFDKAAVLYEGIRTEDPEEPEAHWGMCLCRYGIEYVNDPLTGKKMPTCHRTQVSSILQDADFLQTLKYADTVQKEIYEREAAAIDAVQKGILEISSKEEPFDVFICYKENDEAGSRTPDSVLAQDIYNELRREGFKVFFSRVTLEHKLGTAYEPYIFAALNSAKVMVVLGTKPEYFSAVWVKNEWSRYLMLMQQDHTRMLIPAFRDMDAYELPDELASFQAQDLSRLGGMQDLVHVITKRVGKKTVQAAAKGISPLLDRVQIFLGDGQFAEAGRYCEKILDIDPKNQQAYVYKLFVSRKVRNMEELGRCGVDLLPLLEFQQACRFSDPETAAQLKEIANQINFELAKREHSAAKDVAQLSKVQEKFEALGDYKDAKKQAAACREQIQQIHYDRATRLMQIVDTEDPAHYQKAADVFRKIPGFLDADQKAAECDSKGAHLSGAMEAQYSEALTLSKTLNKADLTRAQELFKDLGSYKNSAENAKKCAAQLGKCAEIYQAAMKLMETDAAKDPQHYQKAAEYFKTLNVYEDAAEKARDCDQKHEQLQKDLKGKYDKACALLKTPGKKSKQQALSIFRSLGVYEDARNKISECEEKIEKGDDIRHGFGTVICKILAIVTIPLPIMLVHMLGSTLNGDEGIPLWAAILVLIIHFAMEYFQGRGFGGCVRIIQFFCVFEFIYSAIFGILSISMLAAPLGSMWAVICGFLYFLVGCIGMYASLRFGEYRYDS